MLAVISLDSVGEPLVARLSAEGRLPVLSRVRREGKGLELIEELPGAAYTTLYTGRRLADHGVHFPLQWSAAHQRARPALPLAAAALERASVFSRLAAHGLRVLVLDPPECVPHAVPQGFLASGIQFRARVLLPRWSRPRAVRRSLLRRLGRPARVDEIYGRPSATRFRHAHAELTAAPLRLAAAVDQLLEEGDFDLVWVTFAAAHQAGHLLWDSSLVPVGAGAALPPDALCDVYTQVDVALGRILAKLPPRTDVMVLSPKGMGPNASRVDLLPRMLDAVLGQRDPRSLRPADPIWTLRACLPVSIRAWAAAAVPEHWSYALTGRLETLGRDWSRTRAFVPPCDVHGFVRFNLAGRERHGIVTSQDVAELEQEIEAGLSSFVDLGGDEPGAPAVLRVERASQRWGEGPSVDHLPDLIVHWRPGRAGAIEGVRSERFGQVLRLGAGTGRTGNHCPGSWLTLLPARARVVPAIDRPGRIEDVASTVCAALGVAHGDLPGQPLMRL